LSKTELKRRAKLARKAAFKEEKAASNPQVAKVSSEEALDPRVTF